MSKYKRFSDFAEAKEKGFADEDGLKPNQDIPNPPKLPKHLKMTDTLAGKDYKGMMTTNPVKGTKDNPLPYKGTIKNDANKDVETGHVRINTDGDEPDSGLAFKGNKIQTAKNSASLGEEPDLKYSAVKNKGKMTSEQFIEQTKHLSPAEFISFFVEGSDGPLPLISDLYGNQFTPNPIQTIQYLAALMVKEPRLLSRLVREIKRHDNGMNMIMDENFNHPEFYSMLAEGMAKPEEGRQRCHRISRAMNDQYMTELEKYVIENINEEVQEKADLDFEEGGPGDGPMGGPPDNPSGMPAKMKQPQGGAFGGGGVGPSPGPLPGGAFGGGGVGPSPGPLPGGAFGGGGVGGPMPPPSNGPLPGGAFGGGGIGSPETQPNVPGNSAPPGMAPPPGTNPGLDMGKPQTQQSQPMPKLKGETAHGNMIEEMGGFPHMKAAMISHCINGDCKKK